MSDFFPSSLVRAGPVRLFCLRATFRQRTTKDVRTDRCLALPSRIELKIALQVKTHAFGPPPVRLGRRGASTIDPASDASAATATEPRRERQAAAGTDETPVARSPLEN